MKSVTRMFLSAASLAAVLLGACSNDDNHVTSINDGLAVVTPVTTIRFINLSRTAINVRQDGLGITTLALDEASSCRVVRAGQPAFVSRFESNALAVRIGDDLIPGLHYDVVAFDTPSGAIRLLTLLDAFTPDSGQVAVRALNLSQLANSLDVFLTPGGSPASPLRIARVLGDSASEFVNFPAGLAAIRLASSNGTSLLLDLQTQTFRAGQRLTLVLRQPFIGFNALRTFVIAGC